VLKASLASVLLSALLCACGEGSYNSIDLMPPPEIYEQRVLDPFAGQSPDEVETHTRLFYATDRRVAGPGDKQPLYANDRGVALRVGTVDVAMDPPAADWDDLRDITFGGENSGRKLQVTGAREIGPLPFSAGDGSGGLLPAGDTAAAGRAFRQAINQQLARSGNRDVFIYVHGYNVDFEYPTLIAKELQHYLGYQGAFISYNWPATPNRFAYLRDLETANATRRNLRELVEYLSDETNARRIHLIGYSAGSRLVFEVAYQIALQNQERSTPRARLGQVILVGSDLDRLYFGQALADGLLEGMDRLSIYMSSSDAALNVSKLLFGEYRLGQIAGDEGIPERIEAELLAEPRLSLIDASDAPGADIGNGHWYFRSSPWASSDIFLTLLSGAGPASRGLVRADGRALWQFPKDYPDRLPSAFALK
jgi:esterase/lipase superfamily enzyme